MKKIKIQKWAVIFRFNKYDNSVTLYKRFINRETVCYIGTHNEDKEDLNTWGDKFAKRDVHYELFNTEREALERINQMKPYLDNFKNYKELMGQQLSKSLRVLRHGLLNEN